MLVASQIYSLLMEEKPLPEKPPVKEVNMIALDSTNEPPYDEFEAYASYRITIYRNRSEIDYDASVPDSINKYLLANPDKKVVITGLYNSTSERSLARERCRIFKETLALSGVSTKRITSLTASYKYEFDSYNKYDRGLLIRYESLTPEDEKEVEEVILPTTKILDSKFINNAVVPDEETDQYIRTLETYLVRHPEKSIKITGYTDNARPENENRWTSKTRAESVRDYFIIRGISSLKIKTLGMGSADPIATNDTKEGRQQNKRVEVTLY